jgi:hypothetical protein
MPLKTPETPVELMEMMDNGEKKINEAAAVFTSQYTVLSRACLVMKQSFDREKSAIYEFSTNGRISRNGKF